MHPSNRSLTASAPPAAGHHATTANALSRRQWLQATLAGALTASGAVASMAIAASSDGPDVTDAPASSASPARPLGSSTSTAGAAGPGLADQWRAMSRLGYGPNAALLQELAAAPDAQTWALQLLDNAAQASLEPAHMAPELQDMHAALPAIFAGAQRERQARKRLKAEAQDTKAASTADSGAPRRFDFSTPPDELNYIRTLVAKTAVWRLTASSSPAQENVLLARMTEFWFNHLNVYIDKGPVRPFVGHYLTEAIRAHAFGQFEDLLLASARHPAMLFYLDQAESVANGVRGANGRTRGLNENYARELMELHTLGVDGGYTQNDVHELARVLTGWTVGPYDSSGFRYVPRLHDTGTKTVLGQRIAAGWLESGVHEGEQAIRMLARHPSTARRVSLRLARFLVSDTPPPALLARMQQQFLASQGNIKSVLRVVIEAPEFWDPVNRLFKTPMDYACSVLTASEAATQRRNLLLAVNFLRNAGQPLHGWQTPDGYPTDAATWLVPEALTRRADFALQVGRQSVPLDFLQAFLGPATRATIARQPDALRNGLALASPEFMYK